MEFRTIPPSFIDVGPKLGVLSQTEITRKFGPEAENSCRKTEGIQSYTRILSNKKNRKKVTPGYGGSMKLFWGGVQNLVGGGVD